MGHHPVNRECIEQVSPVIIRSTENPFCGCHWSSARPVTSELLVTRDRPLGRVQLDELGGRMCSKGAFTGIMDIKPICSGLVREMIES